MATLLRVSQHKLLGQAGIMFTATLGCPMSTAARSFAKTQCDSTTHRSLRPPSDASGSKFAHLASMQSPQFPASITGFQLSQGRDLLTVHFHDETFTFHAQWLYDARCDDGPAKDAANVFSQQPLAARIQSVNAASQGVGTTLDITWQTGVTSRFPAAWLRVMCMTSNLPVCIALPSPWHLKMSPALLLMRNGSISLQGPSNILAIREERRD